MLFKISFKITNEILISYSNIWALNQMCIFPGLELLRVPYYRANPPLFRICTFLSRDYGGRIEAISNFLEGLFVLPGGWSEVPQRD